MVWLLQLQTDTLELPSISGQISDRFHQIALPGPTFFPTHAAMLWKLD